MIHLKLFEGFSNDEEIKKEIFENYNIRNIINDLIDVSLERLDEVEEDEYLDKSIIYEISIEGWNDNYLYSDSIVGGKFNKNEVFTDDDIYWTSSAELSTILKMLKDKESKLTLTFSVVHGEDGELKQLNNGDIIERMSDLYPELEIDTFNPWDIN
jgi:hypothetical protein